MLVGSFTTPIRAYAKSTNGDASLTGWTNSDEGSQYSNILASYVLSTSKDGSASGADISATDIANFGNGDMTKYSYGVYSPVNKNGNATTDGANAWRAIYSLFHYGYLVPNDSKDAANRNGNAFTIGPTSLGLMFYNASYAIVNTVNKGLAFLNPVNVFDLAPDEDEIGDSGNYIGDNSSGWLTKNVKNFFKENGLSSDLIKRIIAIIFSVTVVVFVIVTIRGFTKYKQSEALNSSKHYGLRLIVIAFTIPLAAIATSLAISMSDDSFNTVNNSLSSSFDDTFVDSLAFASNTNFNFGYVSNGNGFSEGDLSTPEKNFEPTPQNISNLNNEMKKLHDGNKNVIYSDNLSKVNGYIENSETFDVGSYIASISNPNTSIAAHYLDGELVTNDENFMLPPIKIGYGKNLYNETTESRTISSVYDISSDSSDDDHKDNNGEKRSGKVNDIKIDENSNTLNGISLVGTNPYDLRTISSQYDPVIRYYSSAGDALNSFTPVSLSKPETYIYGGTAEKSGSKEELNVDSYRYKGTSEKNSMVVQPWDGATIKNMDDAHGDNISGAIIANAVNRAYINSRAGIQNYNNVKSFSTQSVVFLLQTSPFDANKLGLKYKSAVLPPSKASETANVGAKSYVYQRYVIPSSSTQDFLLKVSKLNTIWLSAGIAAVLGLLAFITGPLFGCLIRAFKGWARAQFTGDLFGLTDYIIYYGSVFLSFITYNLAISFGLIIVSVLSGVTDVVSGIGTSVTNGGEHWADFIKQLPFGWGDGLAAGLNGAVGAVLSGLSTLVLAVVLLIILAYPFLPINLGGEQRRVGLVEFVVLIPMALASTLAESIGKYKPMFYGSSAKAYSNTSPTRAQVASTVGKAAIGAGAFALGSSMAAKSIGKGVVAGGRATKAASDAGDNKLEALKYGLTSGAITTAQIAKSTLPEIASGAKKAISGFNAKGFGDVAPQVFNKVRDIRGDALSAEDALLRNAARATEPDADAKVTPDTRNVATDESIDGIGADAPLSDSKVPAHSIINVATDNADSSPDDEKSSAAESENTAEYYESNILGTDGKPIKIQTTSNPEQKVETETTETNETTETTKSTPSSADLAKARIEARKAALAPSVIAAGVSKPTSTHRRIIDSSKRKINNIKNNGVKDNLGSAAAHIAPKTVSKVSHAKNVEKAKGQSIKTFSVTRKEAINKSTAAYKEANGGRALTRKERNVIETRANDYAREVSNQAFANKKAELQIKSIYANKAQSIQKKRSIKKEAKKARHDSLGKSGIDWTK